MKKYFYLLAAALMLAASSVAYAQGPHHHPHYAYVPTAEGLGLHFGYVHSFYRVTDKFTDSVDNTEGKNGFHVGLTKDATLIPYSLYFHTGVDYVYQMANPDINKIGSLKVIAKGQDHRLDIPFQLKYLYPVTPGITAFAMVGPTLSLGMASNLKYRARYDGGSSAGVSYNYYTGKVKTTGEADVLREVLETQIPAAKYRRADLYVGGVVGAQLFDVIELSLGYDWGVVNQYRGTISEDFKMRRQQLYVTLGVRF